MRQPQDQMNQDNDMLKKETGPKPSLADRLRQLADGTLPLIDERMDRDMRGSRNDRGNDRLGGVPGPLEPPIRGRGPMDIVPPPPAPGPGLMGPGPSRRPGDGPPSLLDLPANFPGVPERPDFGAPREFGPRGENRDLPRRPGKRKK